MLFTLHNLLTGNKIAEALLMWSIMANRMDFFNAKAYETITESFNAPQ